MPQTDFFADRLDEENLVQRILEFGRLVPDLRYDTANVMEISDFKTYQQIRHQTGLFYVVIAELVTSAMAMYQIRSGYFKDKFAIRPRQGGPSIILCCYSPYEKDGKRIIPHGHISYYATYQNTRTGKHERASAGLRAHYRSIVNQVELGSDLYEYRGTSGDSRRYWLMPEARLAIQKGDRLGVEGLIRVGS